jgi:FkbM family methyltransferase
MILSIIHSFGKRHTRIRAIFNPIWQPVKRLLWILRSILLVGRPIKFRARQHLFSMVAEGQIAKLMWGGGFEEAERDFVVREIRPGMRVLNIGANAGLYTIIASKMVGDKGHVHAFEPSSQNFNWLKKNIALNNCKNVTVNKLALADFQGQLSLNRDHLHPDMDGHFFVQRISESPLASQGTIIEEISCTTLDDYWKQACGGVIEPVDFIIIDVEGAELAVFEGARETFAASPRLVMIMECTKNVFEIRKFLMDFEFQCYHWNLDSCQMIPIEIERGSFIARREISKN